MDIEITGTYPIIIDGQEIGSVSVTQEGLFWVFAAQSEMLDDILRLSVFGEGSEGYLGVMVPEGSGLKLNKRLSRSGIVDFPRSIEYAGRSGEPSTPMRSNSDKAASAINMDSSPNQDNMLVGDKTTADEHYSPVDVEDDLTPTAPKSENDNKLTEEHFYPVNAEDDPTPVNKSTSFFAKEATPQESVIPPPTENNLQHVRMQSDLTWRPCVLPCSVFSDVAVKRAMGEMKGAMIANEGSSTLLAVPLSYAHEIDQHTIKYFNKTSNIDGSTYVVCRIKDGRPYEASR